MHEGGLLDDGVIELQHEKQGLPSGAASKDSSASPFRRSEMRSRTLGAGAERGAHTRTGGNAVVRTKKIYVTSHLSASCPYDEMGLHDDPTFQAALERTYLKDLAYKKQQLGRF